MSQLGFYQQSNEDTEAKSLIIGAFTWIRTYDVLHARPASSIQRQDTIRNSTVNQAIVAGCSVSWLVGRVIGQDFCKKNWNLIHPDSFAENEHWDEFNKD